MDVLAELKAKASGAISAGLVFVPPDEAVLKLKASAGAGGETSLGDDELMLGSAGGEGEITVRVPLGKVAGAQLLADPKMQSAQVSNHTTEIAAKTKKAKQQETATASSSSAAPPAAA